MKASRRLTQLLDAFEQLRTTAYWDGTYLDQARTQKRWSIGWGTTRYPDTGSLVKEHDTCTAEQANEWRDLDIDRHAEDVNDLMYLVIAEWNANPIVNQDKFDSLVDFAYNVGDGNFRESGLRRLANEGSPEAANEFIKWTLENGKHSNGLLRRRLAERALFLSDFKPDGSLKTEKSDFPDAQWYPG